MLREVLPGVRVLLVDDEFAHERNIDEETGVSIRASLFISQGVFKSRTCLRVLMQSLEASIAAQVAEEAEASGSAKLQRAGEGAEDGSRQIFFVSESKPEESMLYPSGGGGMLDPNRPPSLLPAPHPHPHPSPSSSLKHHSPPPYHSPHPRPHHILVLILALTLTLSLILILILILTLTLILIRTLTLTANPIPYLHSHSTLTHPCPGEPEMGMLSEGQAMAELEATRRKGELKWKRFKLERWEAQREGLEPPKWEPWPLPYEGTPRDKLKFRLLKEAVVRLLRESTPWHRSKTYQQASLLEIAERLIVRQQARDPPFIPGGPLAEKVALHAHPPLEGCHVYVSPNNAGALDFVMDELRYCFEGSSLRVAYSQDHLFEQGDRGRSSGRNSRSTTSRSTRSIASFGHGKLPAGLTRAQSSAARGVTRGHTMKALVAQQASAEAAATERKTLTNVMKDFATAATDANAGVQQHHHGNCIFLLYLDGRTWTSPYADQLKQEVAAQLASAKIDGLEPSILLVHEQDTHNPAHQPVEFPSFYESTPRELIKQGLYTRAHVPLLEGKHRKRSLRDAAECLVRAIDATANSHFDARRWLPAHKTSKVKSSLVHSFVQPHHDDGGISWEPALADNCARDVLNLDAVQGVDDDAAGIEISPVLFTELRSLKPQRTEQEQSYTRGSFAKSDEGKRITIINGKGSARRVLVNGVERQVMWQRRVERSKQDIQVLEEIVGIGKQVEKIAWKVWSPEPCIDALIVKVDPQLDGLVRIQRGVGDLSTSDGSPGGEGAKEVGFTRDGSPGGEGAKEVGFAREGWGYDKEGGVQRSSLRAGIFAGLSQFENPARQESRLCVLEQGLDEGAFLGKSRAERVVKTPDKVGDVLADLHVELPNWPRSVSSLLDVPHLPDDLFERPAFLHILSEARPLWRPRTHEAVKDERSTKQRRSSCAGIGHRSSTGVGISLTAKTPFELRREVAAMYGLGLAGGAADKGGRQVPRDINMTMDLAETSSQAIRAADPSMALSGSMTERSRSMRGCLSDRGGSHPLARAREKEGGRQAVAAKLEGLRAKRGVTVDEGASAAVCSSARGSARGRGQPANGGAGSGPDTLRSARKCSTAMAQRKHGSVMLGTLSEGTLSEGTLSGSMHVRITSYPTFTPHLAPVPVCLYIAPHTLALQPLALTPHRPLALRPPPLAPSPLHP